ncbi:putative oxidoreductase [Wickerhamomyces ciferrii]|uniref:Oxidoreductase n=1 Tax=Wickerhamomyces ciferrii (strain ATCC 14091 / BCRC 22168 / CBS 111 / JCM 3599 / NBRC 0793 / NRRL Y-1031 F-60-10) TaxID=1206466 RepID=K0KN71_WICCF|nr:putative oxidoreductase [Wickerhamomyces ciferrii]CCH44436.1 putative oxidoreductase [Wickerhamomyces ciferrii]
MVKQVLVTGASGYIALHVLDALLAKGYHVIGTVRSQDKADKITKQFKAEYPDAKLDFALVADIGVEGAFNEVLQQYPEITDVLHTASPFSFGLNQDLKEAYLDPATKGTKNALEAIQKFGKNVKHVVVTSSFAAILDVTKKTDPSFVHTEETWNPIKWEQVNNETLAYIASKKYAEELAQEYVAENKPSWTLTTVNPGYVFGPQKFDDVLVNPNLNTSAEIVNKLLKADPSATNAFTEPVGPGVDVRDVAKLHVVAIENDELAGKRLIGFESSFSGQTILNSIHKHFPELDGKVAKGQPEGAQEYADKNSFQVDNSATIKNSGITFTPLDTTFKDSVAQILNYKKSHPN